MLKGVLLIFHIFFSSKNNHVGEKTIILIFYFGSIGYKVLIYHF